LQAQAEQAMMMAAQEKGKYLHVLKLFAAVLAQNSLNGIETVVLHKSVVDQPDTINIAREGFPKDAADDAQIGYSYRVVGDAELQALSAPADSAPILNADDGRGEDGSVEIDGTRLDEGSAGEGDNEGVVVDGNGGTIQDRPPIVDISEAARRKSGKVLRKKR